MLDRSRPPAGADPGPPCPAGGGDQPAVSRTMEVLARLGYGARGIVNLLVGGLAVLAALDLGGRVTGSRGALRFVTEQPLGWIWLGLIGLGLGFFAFWRFVQAIADADRLGTGWRGLSARAAQLGSGVVYLALFTFAVGLVIGRVGDDDAVRRSIDWLIVQPAGPWLVMGVGAGVTLAGLIFAARGLRGATVARFLACDASILRWAVPLGRVGLASRGLVFSIIGGLILLAGWHGRTGLVRDVGGALALLEVPPTGWIVLSAVALGLAAFGVFGLVQALHRRIDPPRLGDEEPDPARERDSAR